MALDRLLAATRNAVPTPAMAADLADAAVSARREREALPAVRAAAMRHRTNAALWQWLGLLYRVLDEQDDAIAAFQHAVQLEPGNVRAMHGLARSAMDAGLPASPLFERAALLAPADGEILLGRAAAHVAEGHGDQALVELDALLERNPGWLKGHEHAAHIRWMSGDRTTFLRTLEQALARQPREGTLWAGAQALLMQAEAYESALDMVERGRRAAGPHRVFDEHEAILASAQGMNARADALFARLAAEGAADFAVHHVRHLLRTGRPETASEEAERWLGGPSARHFWPYVGLAWRLLGDRRSEWLEGDERLVGIHCLADRLPPLDMLAAHLRTLQVSASQQLDQSVRGGTQTIGPLLSRVEPAIRALRAAIVAAVEAYVAQLPPLDPSHPVLALARSGMPRFSGSWSVRLSNAGHHANHVHSEGWLSSALYIALPGPAERGPPPAGWLALGEPPHELGLDLAPFRLIEPKPGQLVLFPSIMWHGTRPFTAGERLTVAFDIAPPAVAATGPTSRG